MIENNKQKLEKEAFELRRRYEKNLHSNGSVLNGLIVMAILSVFALMGCGERSKNSGDFKRTQMNQIDLKRTTPQRVMIESLDELDQKVKKVSSKSVDSILLKSVRTENVR